jgi:CDP-glucose 4,6-dehydratase
MAAQPLVRQSYASPRETFDVNIMGTACLLDAVRQRGKPCVVIVVTSDKCYENRGLTRGYTETDPMGGFDPYSASKGATELLVASYRRSFFPPDRIRDHGVKLASARAGNVIGGGDWARDRIVTDMVAALMAGEPVPVRNPKAIRPWQHVLEPLSGYLTLAAAMLESDDPQWCDGWNFGPTPGGEPTVGELAADFIRAWGKGTWRDVSHPGQLHEAPILRLCIEKAQQFLHWTPQWDSAETIVRTARWYRRVLIEKADAREECMADIAAYEQAASRRRTCAAPAGGAKRRNRRPGRS